MKKRDRQAKILEIIDTQAIETHEDLQNALGEFGLETAQSTLSRDIRELNLVKVKNAQGQTVYTQAQKEEAQNRLKETLQLYVHSVARVEFMLVLKTALSTADILASVIDEMERPEILGTIAGADTLMMSARSVEDAQMLEEQFLQMLESDK